MWLITVKDKRKNVSWKPPCFCLDVSLKCNHPSTLRCKEIFAVTSQYCWEMGVGAEDWLKIRLKSCRPWPGTWHLIIQNKSKKTVLASSWYQIAVSLSCHRIVRQLRQCHVIILRGVDSFEARGVWYSIHKEWKTRGWKTHPDWENLIKETDYITLVLHVQ